MATPFFYEFTSPDGSRPVSRPKHVYYQHNGVRPNISKKHQPPRCSSPRMISRRHQLPISMLTPNTSSMSLGPQPTDNHSSVLMERTPSGNSIMSDTPYEYEHQPNNTLICDDLEAARRVKKHVKRLRTDSQRARILRELIVPKDTCRSKSDEPLDDKALDGIVTAMDHVFFGGKLRRRVEWEWSWDNRYQTDLLATTSLRPRADGEGFETLIVLSHPILRSRHYNRRLQVSTFIHELIHCYLFIMCGFNARKNGGHTEGFHVIAGIIEDWIRPGELNLCNMKANLDLFRVDNGIDNGWVASTIPVQDDWRWHDRCDENARWTDDYYQGPGASHRSRFSSEIEN